MSKKKLHIEGIVNELKGASLFFSEVQSTSDKKQEQGTSLLSPAQHVQAASQNDPLERTNTQMNERAPAQTHKNTDAQLHNRTGTQTIRSTTRESFDIYLDQAETIETLRIRWKRERKKHITKGEVMRELLEEVLAKKR
jgi:hypothetical protein